MPNLPLNYSRAHIVVMSSLPGPNQTLWVEYVKGNETLTVRIFDDENYQNLIEQKTVSGWSIDGLRFLKISPLVEI